MIVWQPAVGLCIAAVITMLYLRVALEIIGGYSPFPILFLFALVTILLAYIPYVGLPIALVVLACLLYKKADAPTPVSAVLAAGMAILLWAFTILGLRLLHISSAGR